MVSKVGTDCYNLCALTDVIPHQQLFRDPRFIREFKAKYCVEAWGEHVVTKKKRKLWRRKDEKFAYPYEEKK